MQMTKGALMSAWKCTKSF